MKPQHNIVPHPTDNKVQRLIPTPRTQAERVFQRFGGVRALWKALRAPGMPESAHRSISALYRWNLPKPTGTGGLVPTCAIPDVMAAARREGILIESEDLYPVRRA